MKATKGQVARVQVVYSQMAAREIGVDNTRDGRLQWASELCQRKITSFSDLSRGEAIHLIDQAQAILGVDYKPYAWPNSREQARRAGLDGRKDVDHEFANAPQIVSDEDMIPVYSFMQRLGWDETRLKAWLASPRSPFAKRESKDIKTKADANQVRWALKRMLQRQGKWDKEEAA
ncbi:hypothetical protein [Terriglobus sp. RCC_193]|uniref:hypothetical protein n=1 Tax=Terriglobus sp. RCC_193 TaxID=3239218 RepID=UPI00352408A2